MSNVNVNQNSQTFNDGRFNSIQTQNIVSLLTLGLPLLPSTTAPTEYTERGFLAFDEAAEVPMYSDGFVWHTLGGGTVTLINTGTGLTGGPITTTGTISIANTTVAPGSYVLTNLTVNAQGQITNAANGAVQTDASLTGSGVTGNVLALTQRGITAQTYFNPQVAVNSQGVITAIADTSSVLADWMTQSSTVSGSATTAPIIATTLDATYANKVPTNVATGTGIYTASVAGTYDIKVWVSSTSGGGTADFIANTSIIKTDSLATNKVIASANNPALTTSSTATPQYSVATTTTLAIGNTIQTQVTTENTASSTTYIAHVSVTYTNGV